MKNIKNDFSPKNISEIEEDNFITQYNNFMNWLCFEPLAAQLNQTTSLLITAYHFHLDKIKSELKFKKEFDLEKSFNFLNFQIRGHIATAAQMPRASEIKIFISELITPTKDLLELIKTALPIILNRFNMIHDNVYPKNNPRDIVSSTGKIEYELNKLRAICLSISSEIDTFGKQLIDSINTLLNCFKRKGATIGGYINLIISLEEITFNDSDFITDLKNTLNVLLKNYSSIIDVAGRDIGGRPFDSLARFFLLQISSMYQNATNKKPTAYKSTHNPDNSGYDGTLYKFAIMCAPLFSSNNLTFFNSLPSIGELSLETTNYYKKLISFQNPDPLPTE